MAYLKGKLNLLAQLVDRHAAADKGQVLDRLGGQLGLDPRERARVKQRVARLADRRFSLPVSAHGATHASGRPLNEDALLVDRRTRLFAVADGMGGHAGGALAAETALRSLLSSLDAGIEAAFRSANAAVIRRGRQTGMPQMGCTLTAIHLAADQVRVAYVGDSRVYRLLGRRLVQLSRDQRLGGHMLFSAVGRPEMNVQLLTERAEPGATYLLCTDGVTDAIDDEQLRQLMMVGRKALPAAPAKIIAAARKAETTDNTTAVVVRIG